MSFESTRKAQVLESEIDFPNLLRVLWAKKVRIVLVTVTVAALALAFALFATPEYRAEAVILVENQEGLISRPGVESMSAPDESAIASQVSVVQSRDLARRAIRDLKLKGDREFDPAASGGGLFSSLTSVFKKDGASQGEPEDRILDRWFKALSAYALPKSRVLIVAFTARDPDLSAQAANKVADLYIDMQSEAKREQAGSAAGALAMRVAELRTRLADAQSKLEAFRVSSGLLTGANSATLPSQQLAEINGQLAAARSTQADSQAKARLLREALRAGRFDAVPDIVNNELIRRISEQRVSIRTQLALESRTLGPEHPRVKELQAQISSVDAELRGAADKLARALENESRIAGSRVDNLLAAVERQKNLVSDTSADEVRLRELTLSAKLIQDQLESTTARWQEAVSRQESRNLPGDARVISRAVAPLQPAFPRKTPIVVFGTVAGLIGAIFWILAAELISGRAYVRNERVTTASSTVRAARDEDTDPSPPEPTPPVTPPSGPGSGRREPYIRGLTPRPSALEPSPLRRPRPLAGGATEALAARLLADAGHDYAERVLVCDAAGAGAACAYDLGRRLAEEARVILVALSGAAGDRPGLGELLSGRASYAAVIDRDSESRLDVVGRGRGPVLADEGLADALDAFSQSYDFVILSVDDGALDLALECAPAADHALVATHADAQDADAVALAEALRESGALDVATAPVEVARRLPDDAA